MGIVVDINKRFWDKVEKTDTCWNWTASSADGRYGQFKYNGTMVLAHRLSWKLHNGPIPEGKHVLHKCNNPRCVNPKHLYIGTHTDNMRDKFKDGTSFRGKNHPLARLTEETVKTIKWLISRGAMQKDLAVIYGVAPNTISEVNSGRTWSHV